MLHTPGARHALIAVAILLVSCATTGSTQRGERSVIEAANKQFMQAVSRTDAAQLANLHTVDDPWNSDVQ